MSRYTKRLWATKRPYIASLIILIIVTAIAMLVGNAVNLVNIGIMIGSIVTFAALFGPVIYIDAHQIRIKHPKPKFVEPKAWVIYSLAIIQLPIVSFLYFLCVFLIFPKDFVNHQLTHDTFIAGVLGGVGLVLIVGLVPSICMVIMKTHYKKIIEFRSRQWYQHHYPQKPSEPTNE